MSPKAKKPVVIEPPAPEVVMGSRYVDEATLERAWRATSRFRSMLPQMQAFVRAITRNPDVNVAVTTGTPCTDGKTVWLRPPIELGDDLEHDRVLCGQRDEVTLAHLCPAHRRHESIMTTLFHECAHICFDSFESLRDTDRAELVRRAVCERPAISTTRLGKLQRRLETVRRGASYVEVNNLLSPYLPMIFNALEDARVNRMMYEARSGTRAWFQGQAINVFEHGIVMPDGSVSRWDERGLNSQAIIALYCRASGFSIKGWFAPEVEAALADPQLGQYLARVSTARSAASVYRLGFPILERLRELGFCRRPDEPEDDPPPPPIVIKTDDAGDDESGVGGSSDSGGVPEEGGESGGVLAPEDAGDDESDAPAPDDSGDPLGDVGDSDDDGTPEPDDSDEEAAGVVSDIDDLPGDDGDDEADGSDDGDDGEAETDDDADDEYGDDDEWDDEDEGDDGADDDADVDGDSASPDDDPADAATDLARFGGHGPVTTTPADLDADEAINRAVVQGDVFDAPSRSILGVNVHRYDTLSERGRAMGWNDAWHVPGADFSPPEGLLAKSLFGMRKTFAYNRASRREAGLRHGRVNSPTVHRVALGDDKVFARTRIPGRRSYFVVIGIDVSGSSNARLRGGGTRLDLMKRAAMAQAELLARVGVGFAVYAHSGHHASHLMPGLGAHGRDLLAVDIFEVKAANEPWTDVQRDRLSKLSPAAANLDGHTLEFYRKVAERDQATDKIILYYTDGAMPLENYDDELKVLQREITTCKRLGITTVGVGVHTDSPSAHGLDTVRIDKIEDLEKLIAKLDRELTGSRVG